MDGVAAILDSHTYGTEPNFLVARSATQLATECFNVLVREYNPVGLHESMLVRELARRAGQMIWEERVLQSVEEEAKQALDIIAVTTMVDGAGIAAHLPIADFFAHDRLASLRGSTLKSSDAFFRLLRHLEDVQRDRTDARASDRRPDIRFAAENQCVLYLARRFRAGRQSCRNCQTAAEGSWIAARKCWECASCRTQTCIRHGTVMARSHVPLMAWFHAIRIMLAEPAITASELSQLIGVRRLATVRGMITKIRAAVAADNPSELLAGLDEIYFPIT